MAPSPGRLFRMATRRWLGPFARTPDIVKVTVRDQDFHAVRVLAADGELAEFRALWSGLIEADPRSWTPPPAYYQLDIQRIGRGGHTQTSRWFYRPGGFVNLLAIWRAIWVAPLYRTPSPGAFETLLRGSRSPLAPGEGSTE